MLIWWQFTTQNNITWFFFSVHILGYESPTELIIKTFEKCDVDEQYGLSWKEIEQCEIDELTYDEFMEFDKNEDSNLTLGEYFTYIETLLQSP